MRVNSRTTPMNSNSIILVLLATAVGAAVLYVVVFMGMNASDDFASRLSMNSTEYIREREEAMLEGKDPLNITLPAARSHQPSDYDPSLSATETSPYVRPDTDGQAGAGDASDDNQMAPPESAEKLASAAENVATDSLELTLNSADNAESTDTPLAADENADSEAENEDSSDANATEENPVHAAIRKRLATEEMSDSKRAALEAVLPQPKAKSVRAIDVRLQFDPDSCVVPRNSNSWIGVNFRTNSASIRGMSLSELDDLIQLRDRCGGSLVLEHYALAVSSTDVALREDRSNEVKYYLLQRHVPKESIEVINPK